MRTRPMRFALLSTATAGLVLTQQACANGTAAEPAAAPSATQVANTTPSTTSEASGSGTSAGTGSGSTGATVANCKTSDIAATITLQPGGEATTRTGLVTLTNKSAMECNIGGRAAISLKNPANEVVDVPTQNVDEPGKAARTVLRAGSSVFQGIKWTTCDMGDDTCGAGNTLVFSLEASTDGNPAQLSNFPAPERNAITMKSLTIGTIQLSRQGVVAW